MIPRLGLVLSGCLFVSLLTASPAPAAKPADIGSRRELFVDGFLVDRLEGVRHRLHRPRPAEISVTLDRPWEKHFYNGVSVIHDTHPANDKPRFLLYYSASNRLAVAVSHDGVHWKKPLLGIVEIDGNRKNTLGGSVDGRLMVSDKGPMPEIFLDRRPGVKPSERFKAFTLIEGRGGTRVIAWISGDGFRFSKLRDKPIIHTRLYGAFDGFESMFWSEVEQQYVIYLRYAIKVSPPNPRDPNRRSVARMSSKDLLNWTKPRPMTFGKVGLLPPDHHYNNQTMPYFRAPQIYVALSNRLAQTRQALSRAEGAKLKPSRSDVDDPLKWLIGDCADTVMLTTRASAHYDRLFMEGIVRPGPGAENWTTRSNYTLRGLHPTSPREMSVWVTRHNGQTSCHVRRFVFRTDGLASIEAPYAGGDLVTRPLRFSGKSLQINYATSAVGGLRVEIQNDEGKPIQGFSLADCPEMIGDRIDQVVTWKSGPDLGSLSGKTVRLRFRMKDANLFSLRFTGGR